MVVMVEEVTLAKLAKDAKGGKRARARELGMRN